MALDALKSKGILDLMKYGGKNLTSSSVEGSRRKVSQEVNPEEYLLLKRDMRNGYTLRISLALAIASSRIVSREGHVVKR